MFQIILPFLNFSCCLKVHETALSFLIYPENRSILNRSTIENGCLFTRESLFHSQLAENICRVNQNVQQANFTTSIMQ